MPILALRRRSPTDLVLAWFLVHQADVWWRRNHQLSVDLCYRDSLQICAGGYHRCPLERQRAESSYPESIVDEREFN